MNAIVNLALAVVVVTIVLIVLDGIAAWWDARHDWLRLNGRRR